MESKIVDLQKFLAGKCSKKYLESALVLYNNYSVLVYGITAGIVGANRADDVFVEVFNFITKNSSAYDQRSGSFKLWIINTSRRVAIENLLKLNNAFVDEPLTLKKTISALYKFRSFSSTEISAALHIPLHLVIKLQQPAQQAGVN
ncbi:MAG: hypothetical protein V4717_20415 [Bacteroidota bacterium]